MKGGVGADDFDFNVLAEMGKTAATRDVISDFAIGLDDIDLATIDANGGGGREYLFVSGRCKGAAFTGVAGQLRWSPSASLTRWSKATSTATRSRISNCN